MNLCMKLCYHISHTNCMKTEAPTKIVSIHPNSDALQTMCPYFRPNSVVNCAVHEVGGAFEIVASVTHCSISVAVVVPSRSASMLVT